MIFPRIELALMVSMLVVAAAGTVAAQPANAWDRANAPVQFTEEEGPPIAKMGKPEAKARAATLEPGTAIDLPSWPKDHSGMSWTEVTVIRPPLASHFDEPERLPAGTKPITLG